MKTIWLFIGYDRHCDDIYQAFKTFKEAYARADEFMAFYKGRYDWTRKDPFESRPTQIGKWAYQHRTFDDGPSVRVELIAFGPQK